MTTRMCLMMGALAAASLVGCAAQASTPSAHAVAVDSTVDSKVDSDGPADGSQTLLIGVAPGVRERLRQLDHADWATRDGASRWLVQHREQWLSQVSQNWRPATPEARWRWRGILTSVALLADLPQRLERDQFEDVRGSLVAIAREHGGPEVARSLAPALQAPGERVRERAVRLVAELDAPNLRQHLARCAVDASPWVRRAVYEVALEKDCEWMRRLLLQAIESNDRTASEDVVTAARRLRDKALLKRLRELWWPDASPALRRSLCHAWRGIPELLDAEVLDWQLASGEYPLVVIALEAIEAGAHGLRETLVEALGSEYFEVRTRVRTLLTQRGSADLALALLPELECDDDQRASFAARCLVEWQAEDYYGDLAAVLGDGGRARRGPSPLRRITREESPFQGGPVKLQPASAKVGDGECNKSGEFRPPPSGN